MFFLGLLVGIALTVTAGFLFLNKIKTEWVKETQELQAELAKVKTAASAVTKVV